MKRFIIGHRGAAGLALENSQAAIERALEYNVDMIEIDVRLTSDQKLVVCHDTDLARMTGSKQKISHHTLEELRNTPLRNGNTLLLLEDALHIAGKTPVMVELKDTGSEHALLEVLNSSPNAKVAVASFKAPVLVALRELNSDLPLYILNHTDALDTVHAARRWKFNGVALNVWTLSPHVYWLAKRYKLDIYVYTVNSRFIAWFLSVLYPRVKICTDRPDRFTGTDTIES